jgi:hypothetical protein
LLRYDEELCATETSESKRLTLNKEDIASLHTDLFTKWKNNQRFADIVLRGQKLRLTCSGDSDSIQLNQIKWLENIKLHS